LARDTDPEPAPTFLVLPEDPEEALRAFQEILKVLNWGTFLCLGPDAKGPYDFAKKVGKPDYMRYTTVWAKEPEVLREQVRALPGGKKVEWGEFGHQVAVIDHHDKVVVTLSRSEATDELTLLIACSIAAGG